MESRARRLRPSFEGRSGAIKLRLDVIVLIICALALVLLVYERNAIEQKRRPSVYSTYDTGPNGYRALYEVLRAARVPARRFERDLPTLDPSDQDADRYRIRKRSLGQSARRARCRVSAPLRAKRREARRNRQEFAGPQDVTPGVGTTLQTASRGTAIALAGNAYTAGVASVGGPIYVGLSVHRTPRRSAARERSKEWLPYGTGFGRGEVIAVTAPAIFGNAQLRNADNLRFAYNVIAGHGDAAFDEYVHGHDNGLTTWGVTAGSVRAAVWIVVAVVAIALIGANVPFAPPYLPDAPDERDSSRLHHRNGRADAPFPRCVPPDDEVVWRGDLISNAERSTREADRFKRSPADLSDGMGARLGRRRSPDPWPNDCAARTRSRADRRRARHRQDLGGTHARVLLGLEFRRIAFTPDLMPSDVVGTTVFNPQTAQFTTRIGPIVANIVLADEVNRTPPKTQSALLEAMEEGRVTIDGVSHPLPQPFLLCATQNPIEYEGTYPLPEAQLDRFMIKAESSYPAEAQELELLARTAAGFDARALETSNIAPVTNAPEMLEAQEARSDASTFRRRARVHVSDRRSDALSSATDAGSLAACRHCAAHGIAGRGRYRRPRLRYTRRRERVADFVDSAPLDRRTRCRNRRHFRAQRGAGYPRNGSRSAWLESGFPGGSRRAFFGRWRRLRCSLRVRQALRSSSRLPSGWASLLAVAAIIDVVLGPPASTLHIVRTPPEHFALGIDRRTFL